MSDSVQRVRYRRLARALGHAGLEKDAILILPGRNGLPHGDLGGAGL